MIAEGTLTFTLKNATSNYLLQPFNFSLEHGVWYP